MTVGPSPRLLPAGASLQPCLQSRGPGSTSRKLMLPAWGGGSRAQRPCSGSRGAQGFSNRCPHSLEDLERNGSSGAGDGKPKGSRSQLLTMTLIGTGSGPWPGGAARVSGVAGPLIPGAGAIASCSLPGEEGGKDVDIKQAGPLTFFMAKVCKTPCSRWPQSDTSSGSTLVPQSY